jgi:hypothetical protein
MGQGIASKFVVDLMHVSDNSLVRLLYIDSYWSDSPEPNIILAFTCRNSL